MAADVEMTGVEPITADSDLPPPSIVEQWTPEQLFGFAPIPKIVWNDEVRAIFCKAGISGSIFLERGHIEDFWFRRCGLPIGPSAALAGLAQTIKNMGKEESQVQSPPAPWDGKLPTPSSVEQWTEKELLDCILVKEILADGEVRAKFKEAKINGKAFLRCGDDLHFWTDVCHLPPGHSANLLVLAERIKNMGKEESRVESPPKPTTDTKTAARLEFLHVLLWGQEKPLLPEVFPDFQHPSWNLDTNPHLNSNETRTAVKLTLSHITRGAPLLPCGAKELLVRKVYREMYGILVKAQEDRMKYLDENEFILDSQKMILILGQPGIGKTWFLTYVLVRRLLEGKPTIFQVGGNFGGDRGYTTGTDYLIDSNGVRAMAARPPFFELDNPDIWVLADRMPFGRPREFAEHNWLVVVTSSPREANHKHIVKECSPRTFYFPTWDWNEIVAAAALKGLSEKMWDTLFTLFDRYGPIPRLLFDTLLPPSRYGTGMVEDGTAVVDEELQNRIMEYDQLLQDKIIAAVKLDPNIVLSTEYGVNCSHSIFAMRPCKMEKYQYVSVRRAVGLATADIGRRIGEAAIAKSLKDAQRWYDFLLRQGETSTSAGWVFEARMHLVFQHGGPFEATKLDGSTTITIDIHQKSCQVFSKVSEIGTMLRKQPRSKRINPDIIGGYFKPQHCNLPSVDSFTITKCATTKKPLLVLFQMTVSTQHPVKGKGLSSIWAELPEKLRKTPPILVFVVPVAVANAFSSNKQSIVASVSETSAIGSSASHTPNFETWEQYVLPVSNETLWENTMAV